MQAMRKIIALFTIILKSENSIAYRYDFVILLNVINEKGVNELKCIIKVI